MTTAATRAEGRPLLRLVSGGHRPLRVAVLGGGIGGLASAHFLAKAGHHPVVFEAARQLGGLASQFEHLGVSLDRWHHVVLAGDAELIALLGELGLADEARWSRTDMGVLVDGRLYGFNTPLDLLRFERLALPDRLRIGLGVLYAGRVRQRGDDLDRMRAVDWLERVFGPRAFARLWDPLLRAAFGDRHEEIPAYWAWNLLRRVRDGSREGHGALRCGSRGLVAALHIAVTRRGGQVRLRSPVECLDETAGGVVVTTPGGAERFDAAVSTLALPLLARIARGPLAAAVPLPALRYQGVVNAVVVSRSRLERFHWTAVIDRRVPFQGVVETTQVVPPEWVGGRHLYHLMQRCDAESAVYQRSDDVVAGQAVEGLAALYPHFRRRDVEAVYVFRAPHVEPVWTVGYLERRPAPRVGRSRLYLCTSAQAYPRVTSWNTSVALAAETVTCVLDDLARARVAAG
jgi:protoporphyrinogen oxidase